MENKHPKEIWVDKQDLRIIIESEWVHNASIWQHKVNEGVIKYISESHHNEIVSELQATIKNMEFGMQHLAKENERLEKEKGIKILNETTCKCETIIGETKLWCCNQCGKRTEEF